MEDPSSSGLIGREDEQHRLDALIRSGRNARAGSIFITGEPGMGKTALLDDALSARSHARILRIDGYESEATIPYAALHRLILPVREFLTELPARYVHALDVAVGRQDGPAPDRFLVGLGLLDVLGTAAETQATICAIDDVHLVDSESLDAIAFVARRLLVERLTLICAGRDENDVSTRLRGIETMRLTGLASGSAVRLLSRAVAGPIDPAAAAAISDSMGGNPLALTDLATTVSPDELNRLSLHATPMPVGRRLEQHYMRRVQTLDSAAQTWLLLAAADSTAPLEVIDTAAAAMGLDPGAFERAETSALVEIRTTARFRHPLVCAAIYNAASPVTRRRAHTALATAAQQHGAIELRAWHASRAALGPDPDVADQLEQVADTAARRGGFASRARLLVRAAELTPAGHIRDRRRVAAAEAAFGSGAAGVAAGILDDIDATNAAAATRGRVIMARADLAVFNADGPGNLRACADLIAAANLFHDHDPQLEQRALIRAVSVCMSSERLMQNVTTTELGQRLHRAAALDTSPASIVLAGLSAVILLPYDDAVPSARAALDEIFTMPNSEIMRMGVSIAVLGTFLWDHVGRARALTQALDAARDAGALQEIDSLLWIASLSELSGGTVTQAVRHNELVREVRRAMGYDAENVVNAALMAWIGAPTNVVLAIAEGANAAGFGGVGASAVAAVAIRDLADGNYQDAYDRLEPLIDSPFLQVTPTQFADFTEAAARIGRADQASTYARRLEDRATANGSVWCRGVAERAAGLAAEDREAEEHYRAAVDTLEVTNATVDRARAHLLYGEWLRRARRRLDARTHLRTAIELFELSGATIFVPRAQNELRAAGASPDISGPALPVLTAQELAIAEKAAAGRTNAEIASNMFISTSTVDYHLRKVFRKLGVSSRRQLAEYLD